ncbi:MAG: DegT/DnrJ/EryC1/StrS aminotransferase family protein, partial [bacterium]|nr:DegT/DnrJ/EryC1/StrS aminotransferase family protein [bacterium]
MNANIPAIEGGTPVRDTFLSFHQALLDEKEESSVIQTLRSGWLTTGPKTKQFEAEFAKYARSSQAVAVNSCTAALHLALVAAGIGKVNEKDEKDEKDEVITTPMTFCATANVIVHVQADPVFVDVDPVTLNIDVNKIEEKITSKTRAIIPVHYAGCPCEMDEILGIAKKYNIIVIEDAAHATETEYHGKKVGSISDMTAFSFYATKNLTTAEGGMLTTNSERLEEKIRVLAIHGMSKDAWKRYSPEGYQHYEVLYPGYKYNMTDIQAALGLCQLAKIEDFLRLRQKHVAAYDEAFKDMEAIVRIGRIPDIKHAEHLYVIMLKTDMLNASRDKVLSALQKENIGVSVHFQALHLHPYYRQRFGFSEGAFPVTEYAAERILSLPLYPGLTEQDVCDVIEAVRKVVGYY